MKLETDCKIAGTWFLNKARTTVKNQANIKDRVQSYAQLRLAASCVVNVNKQVRREVFQAVSAQISEELWGPIFRAELKDQRSKIDAKNKRN